MLMIISGYFIFSSREFSTFLAWKMLIPCRYGPHKVAKILYQAFCLNLVGHLRGPGIDAQVVSPSLELPTPLDAGSHSPMSATQDFATLSPPPLVPLKENAPSITPPPDVTSAPEPPKVDDVAALPVIPPPVTPPTAPPTISEPVPPTVTIQQEDGLRVLLVEDNEINLKLLIATMRKLKLDHVTATNGLEALNSYKENDGKFDVIFMGMSSLLFFSPFSPFLPPHFIILTLD
jgi:CheY-like chemotaxis protein